MHDISAACSRRSFLSASCGAYVALALASGTTLARRAFAAAPAGETIRTEPFARVEKIADGVWAVVSTPAGGRQTVSNGGIIAGREGVLCVEGLNTPEGGAWLSETALALTGRRPTHVVLTHYHADHSAGLGGHLCGASQPAIVGTAATRNLLAERYGRVSTDAVKDGGLLETGRVVLPNSVLIDDARPHTIDLGGRAVRLVPRSGHTPSDLTIEIEDPRVVFCGDLVFNGLFPYYGDAIPSKLGETCHRLLQDPDTLYVPGHGSLADADALRPYLALLEDVERAARDAWQRGVPAAEAWRAYSPPPSLGQWAKFRENVYQFAFEAWERELRAAAR